MSAIRVLAVILSFGLLGVDVPAKATAEPFDKRVLRVGPVTVKGYTLMLHILDFTDGDWPASELGIRLTRSVERGRQSYTYRFPSQTEILQAGVDLRRATVDSSDSFGPHASLLASFGSSGPRGTTTRDYRGSCWTSESRVGTIEGSIVIDLRDDYFGRIELDRASAELMEIDHESCESAAPLCKQSYWQLASYGERSSEYPRWSREAVVRRDQHRVLQLYRHIADHDIGFVYRTARAWGSPDHFDPMRDMSSARVVGIGPFFSGELHFSAAGAPAFADPDPCGTWRDVAGTVVGGFTVEFDSGGPETWTGWTEQAALVRWRRR